METKDSEIENLMVLKRGQPDVRLEQRVSLLEQEVKCASNGQCNAIYCISKLYFFFVTRLVEQVAQKLAS